VLLSHLDQFSGPNLSLTAPPAPTALGFYYLGPSSSAFASSKQHLFTPVA